MTRKIRKFFASLGIFPSRLRRKFNSIEAEALKKIRGKLSIRTEFIGDSDHLVVTYWTASSGHARKLLFTVQLYYQTVLYLGEDVITVRIDAGVRHRQYVLSDSRSDVVHLLVDLLHEHAS